MQKFFLNNLSSITIANLKEWTTNIILSWTTSKISHLKCSVNSCEQPGWYHVHYEQPAQRMSNQHVYYSLWATNYFSLKFFSKSKMCQRGPGDAGRILPLVSYLLSYLFRYPLGINVVPFGISFYCLFGLNRIFTLLSFFTPWELTKIDPRIFLSYSA